MIDLKIDSRLFESETISFTVRADDPRAVDLIEDAAIEQGGRRYFIKEVTDTLDERGALLKAVEAEIGWMRLADIRRISSFEIEDRTAEEGLEAILLGTTWSVGSVMTTTDFFLEATDSTILSLIWDWCRIVGGEPIFDTMAKTVGIALVAGTNRGVAFRYGRNLKSIKRTATAPTATRIYAWGRNDLRMSSGPYLEDYSWYTNQGISLEQAKADYRKDDVITDDAITSATVLTNVTAARLAVSSKPTISYSASVVDLSSISGAPEGDFFVGDIVQVYDEIIGTELIARINRRVHNPQEPFKDEVELTFNAVILPDSGTSGARTSPTLTWELYKRSNTGLRQVRMGHTLLGRLKLQYVPGTEYIVSYNIEGVAVGDHTLTLEFTDDETGLPYWATQTISLTNGQLFKYTFTRAVQDVQAAQETLVVRAYTDNNFAGLNINAERSNLWVLARGARADAVTLENSITFNYTAAIQYWAVPDDVSEIQIEAVGGKGGFTYGGKGARVFAGFPVIAGTEYDIIVGGEGTDYYSPGWPNGGSGAGPGGGAVGGGGGASSSITPRGEGINITNAIIVAAGGGGCGEPFQTTVQAGGDGGFYEGESKEPGNGVDLGGHAPGDGATQYAGGAGGIGTALTGYPGTFGQGGNGNATTNSFAFPPGGGGGGWYGGGGGGAANGNGQGTGGGGGGGSGWIAPAALAFDIDVEDGVNSGHGYITISWDDPGTL